MKKPEAEKLIPGVVHDWARDAGFDRNTGSPSFSEFKVWLLERWPGTLSFRSRLAPEYDAELWFDMELGQIWRR